ncbi:MAG: ATP-binding protein, partial [Alkalispirochaetaceae bacterium]
PGVITVEFRRDGDSYSLRVRDNGVGMSSEATRSLGLTLVETLAEQLGGTLECFLEHGTCVTIRFEASEQGGPQPPRLPA